MAKVKITGHESGTGVVTVTAPNTSTDRTITLPDATATIATTTDVAARLPSITDSANTVLIGGVTNTSGGYPFKIGDSGNDGELAMLADGDASQITSYDRTASAYHPIIMYASAVTMPLQPAFLVKNITQSNIAVGSDVTVKFSNEIFDQNTDFNTSTYTFTAPVTGKYQLNVSTYLNAIDTDTTYLMIKIATSNRTYNNIIDPNFTADPVYYSLSFSILADMDAGDTAHIVILQSGGVVQTDVQAECFFSGYLVA